MKPWVVKSAAALVLTVAVVAVGLGLSTPDGAVRDPGARPRPRQLPRTSKP